MTNWQTVHDGAASKPATIDTTTSAFVVYERKNIRQETTTHGEGDNAITVTEWVYEQREYTREEYEAMCSPATQRIMQAISDLQLDVASIGLE